MRFRERDERRSTPIEMGIDVRRIIGQPLDFSGGLGFRFSATAYGYRLSKRKRIMVEPGPFGLFF